VNYQKASQSMQEVFKNYKKFKIPAKKQAMGNRAKFSLDAMTRELGKILDKYVPEFPKEVALKLPKLKKVGDTQPQKISLPKLKKV
jgi:hypothetical protein